MTMTNKDPLVSAIVSTYNAARFIRGCLQDLEAQTIADRLEIVVIDSGSEQNERAVVEEFQRRYGNIRYMRTERESVYAAWNRGIRAARGKYLTNANTDDRHRVDAFELQAGALDQTPDVGLVYADSLITNSEGGTFERNSASRRFDLPDYSLGTLLCNTFFGPHPMWRRSVHDRTGYFDPSFVVAGDYEFWIRLARDHGAVHLRETLGLYNYRDESVSGATNAARHLDEVKRVLQLHRERAALNKIYPTLDRYPGDPNATAAALWDYGNVCALGPNADYELALKMYERAINLNGLRPELGNNLRAMYANNIGVLLFCGMEKEHGRKLLGKVMHLPSARSNLELMSRLERIDCLGERVRPIFFVLEELHHPVVTDARRAHGLRLNENGALERTPEHQQLFWDIFGIYQGVPIGDEEKARAVARKPRLPDAAPRPRPETSSSGTALKPGAATPPQAAADHLPRRPAVEPKGLRIVFVVHGFPPHSLAGTEIYTHSLARELTRRGHTVRIVYPEYDTSRPEGSVTEDFFEGLAVTRITIDPNQTMVQKFKNEPAAAALGRYLAGLGVDLVHFQHLIGFSAAAVRTCAERGLPAVMTAHDGWLLCEQIHFIRSDGSFCEKGPETVDKCVQCFVARHPELSLADHVPQIFHDLALRRQYCRSTLRHFDNLLVPSRFIGEVMAAHGFDHPSIITAPLGLRPFRPLPWRPQIGTVRFGFLGSIYYTKGIDVLIRAFNQIDPEKARLDLFGNIADPAYFRHVMDQVGPRHRVEYHGQYTPEDLPDILAKTDVAVIPSRCESFSIVARECLHAGVPVIASRVGGLPEIVEDGKNGLLFQSEDHEDLAQKLAFFAQNPEQAAAFRGRTSPVRTIAEDAGQIESIYRYTLLSRGRRPGPGAPVRQDRPASPPAREAARPSLAETGAAQTKCAPTPAAAAAPTAPVATPAQAAPAATAPDAKIAESKTSATAHSPSITMKPARKPHVLFTMAGWREEAGGTQLPRQIAEALVERGYRVSVIATSNRPQGAQANGSTYEVFESRERGVDLLVIDRPWDFKTNLAHPEAEMDDPIMRRLIAGLVVKSEPDVVHYHSLHNFSLGTPELVHRLRIPSVYTSHNYWPLCPRMYLFRPDTSVCDGPSADGSKCAACVDQAEKQELFKERIRLSRHILDRCIDRHVTVSQRAREIFVGNGYEASRIRVVPIQSGTVDEIWGRLGRTRQPEGLHGRPLRVGFMGNLFVWKGAHVLMEALQAFRPGQIECHIFGDGPESYVGKLRQMDNGGLARFHGGYGLSRLPDLLRLMDVAISPSICEETGGLVALEALAGRAPVIGSRIGGIPELIRDGVTGLLFNPGDARELVNALTRFIEEPDLLKIMQANIEAPRGFARHVDDLAAHYEEVIAAHTRGS